MLNNGIYNLQYNSYVNVLNVHDIVGISWIEMAVVFHSLRK